MKKRRDSLPGGNGSDDDQPVNAPIVHRTSAQIGSFELLLRAEAVKGGYVQGPVIHSKTVPAENPMKEYEEGVLTKVPAITLGFWAIKILATTFGETMGDTVSMSWLAETTDQAGMSGFNGYLIGTALFGSMLAALIWLQIRARRFHPLLYWATIIASTTAGTTLADFATRSLGIGYPGGSMLLFAMLMVTLLIWRSKLGSVSVATIHEPRAELYYWLTITFSQTLGTALGDWVADGPLGYSGAAIIFGGLLLALALAYAFSTFSRVALFWAAFILTRPLGAVVGDYLDKPVPQGGLELSRLTASVVLAAAIMILILVVPQRPGRAK